MRYLIEITSKSDGIVSNEYILDDGANVTDVVQPIKDAFEECGKRGLNAPDFEYFISNVWQDNDPMITKFLTDKLIPVKL